MENIDNDYRTDGEYIYHYSSMLSPVWMRFALLLQGVDLPDRQEGEPFRYMELGFGQGLSLLIHAAANDGEYWGVDFLQAHAEKVDATAKAAGLNCNVLHKSFKDIDEMSAAGELPQFDVVTLHGIWSWINDENRQHILNFLSRCLKPGGAVYLSYNAMPGWAFFAPIRDLMLSVMKRYGGDESNIEEKIRDVMKYVIDLSERDMVYFKLNPRGKAYLKSLTSQPANYLAQEFFNRSWYSFYFREVAEDMERAGCRYVSSGDLLSLTSAYVRPDAWELISQTINPYTRETLRDFAVERKFRTDYFVRSPKRLGEDEQFKRLGDQAMQLLEKREDIKYSVNMHYESIELSHDIFDPIFDGLAQGDVSTKRIRDITERFMKSREGRKALLEVLSIAIGSKNATVVVGDVSPAVVEASKRLNLELCRKAFEGERIQFLAAPRFGGGIAVTQAEQLLILFRPGKTVDPDEWGRHVAEEVFKRGGRATSAVTAANMAMEARNLIGERLSYLEFMGVM